LRWGEIGRDICQDLALAETILGDREVGMWNWWDIVWEMIDKGNLHDLVGWMTGCTKGKEAMYRRGLKT